MTGSRPTKLGPAGRSSSCTSDRCEPARCACDGVALVETLVALTVLTIGLIAVSALTAASRNVIVAALEETDATLLATQAIERRLAERAGRMAPGIVSSSIDGREYQVQVDERVITGSVTIRAEVIGAGSGSRRALEIQIVGP